MTDTLSNARRVRDLESALARFLEAGDADSVHDARVAAGRLSVWLQLTGRTIPSDDLRWIRTTLAATRDLDVGLARGRDLWPAAWTGRLALERAAAATAARTAFVGTRVHGTLEALRVTPAPPRHAIHAETARLAGRALRAGDRLFENRDERIDQHPEEREHDAECLHRARRRFRRLRHALDWSGHDATVVKSLQDAFGASNDASVILESWIRLPAHVRAEIGAARAHEVERELRRDVEERTTRALARWREVRAHVARLAANTRSDRGEGT